MSDFSHGTQNWSVDSKSRTKNSVILCGAGTWTWILKCGDFKGKLQLVLKALEIANLLSQM